ncbi:E3 ubiquitin-protein ligase rad18 [Entophlyctis luteolus]|nr:E3 ubiquitin-protein ligase rad18 [Entophlyctis luteolus]
MASTGGSVEFSQGAHLQSPSFPIKCARNSIRRRHSRHDGRKETDSETQMDPQMNGDSSSVSDSDLEALPVLVEGEKYHSNIGVSVVVAKKKRKRILTQGKNEWENYSHDDGSGISSVYSNNDTVANNAFVGDQHDREATKNAILAKLEARKRSESRSHRPAIAYDAMKESQLRKILKDEGLRTTGDKGILKRRHQEFVLLHNSNLDSPVPKPQSHIMQQMNVWEQTHGAESNGAGNTAASMHALAAFNGHVISEEGIKRNQCHMEKYADHFRDLIAAVRERRKQKLNAMKETP